MTLAIDRCLDEMLHRPDSEGRTLACVVSVGGEVVAERYGSTPDTIFGPGSPVTRDSTLISWSMAKSITHALVGIAQSDGLLSVDENIALTPWIERNDPPTTWNDLLEMRSGLLFVEDYLDGEASHCIEMLFSGEDSQGVDDMGLYAASLPRVAQPGEQWSYSSGTTNVLCRMLGDRLAGGGVGEVGATARRKAIEQFATERLFRPLRMGSTSMKFDATGTFVGSSFVYATARDFVQFGELYRRNGYGPSGERILPQGWVEHGRTKVAHDPDGAGPFGFDYGRHWWLWPNLPGSMAAHGYQGQFILVVPERELTLVHLGITDVGVAPRLVERINELVSAL